MLVTDASVGRVLGGAQIVPEKNRESFLLSKNVCWCWLRMLLLAEYVPATMLDPKALGTAFQKKKQKVRMELHILTFIEQCSGLQGRRRCLAAGVLDIWHGTDPLDPGTAQHGKGHAWKEHRSLHTTLPRVGSGKGFQRNTCVFVSIFPKAK